MALGRKLLVRKRNGTWELRLPDRERELLASLADQLDGLMSEEPDSPGLRRLFPTAYPDDVASEAEWQVFRAGDLRSSRTAHLAVLRETATRRTLDDDQLQAWMQAINALRLVLGTMLDVDEDEIEIDEDDPQAPTYAVYGFLSYLLDATVTAMSG